MFDCCFFVVQLQNTYLFYACHSCEVLTLVYDPLIYISFKSKSLFFVWFLYLIIMYEEYSERLTYLYYVKLFSLLFPVESEIPLECGSMQEPNYRQFESPTGGSSLFPLHSITKCQNMNIYISTRCSWYLYTFQASAPALVSQISVELLQSS